MNNVIKNNSKNSCRRHLEYIIPVVSIALFLATFPLQTSYNTWAMVIMLAAMLIAFILHKPRTFRWQPVFFALCALYLIKITGLLFADNLYAGVRQLDSPAIPLLAFPLIFSVVHFSEENVMLLLRFFVWVAIVFCGFGFLSYAAIVPGLGLDMVVQAKIYAPLLLMWPSHWHPSYVSVILLMAVPISLSLPLRRGGCYFGEWLFRILGVAFPVVFTVLAGARVGMVVIPFLLALAYLFYCRFKPVLKWGLVVAGLTVAVCIYHRYPQADDRFDDPIRKDLRTLAIDAIKEKPIFGWGTGSSKALIQSEERVQRLGTGSYTFNGFHNQYLDEVAQFGIPGALVLLALFGWLLYLAVRRKDFLLLSLLVIYLLFCWTETPFGNFKGVVPFAFWVCFLVATQRARHIYK